MSQDILRPAPISEESFGIRQGLSQGLINCIYQDKEGYMWISTKDGLNRYDGYKITVFRNDPKDPYSLPDNFVNATLEDDNNNFWVGTNSKGLFLFDKKTERFYPVPVINKIPGNNCIRYMQYADGKLFVNSYTNAFIVDIKTMDFNTEGSKAVQKAKIVFDYNKSIPNKNYTAKSSQNLTISWVSNNGVWAVFPDSIFHFKNNKNYSKYTLMSYASDFFGIKNNTFGAAYFFPVPNQKDVVVVAHKNTIKHFNTTTQQIVFEKTICSDRNTVGNKKYYSVNDGQVCLFLSDSMYIYNIENKSTTIKRVDKPFTQIFIDKNEVQWLGSSGFGLSKYDQRKKAFRSFETKNTMDMYTKLQEDKLPNLPLELLKSMDAKFNRTLLDKNGVYWVNVHTSLGKRENILISYDTKNKKFNRHAVISGKDVNNINIFNDAADRLWVYRQNGENLNTIGRIDKKTGKEIVSYPIPDAFDTPDDYVLQFYLDAKSLMWLATINGLYAFNESTKTWKHWKNNAKDDQSLSSDKLLSICPDPENPEKYLWIGTEGAGINRFEKETGKCIRYDEKDGLPNNVAYCILSDSMKNLWVSTNKGLSCFDPVKKTFRNFTEEDGLPGDEFNRTQSMYMPNAELMFGGVDGFVIFNPKDVLKKQPAVPIVFTGATIFNKPIHWKKDSLNLSEPIEYTKNLTLQPGQNIFSISFASLEYRNNEKKMYRYKLEGFDPDWTSPDKKNEVTYTNLAPGTYTFFVMGANTDGVWNDKPISMEIIVLPFWYQTIWFNLVVLLLLGSAVYGFYRYRLQQGLKIEKLRNRIARDLHDEIGSTLSSISIYAEAAKMVSAGNSKAEDILTKINTNTSDMMEAMSDIVWAVNSNNDQFSDLANRLRSFAVQLTDAKNIALVFTDNKNLPEVTLNMEQRKNIYLICKEAISNAVKYSKGTLLEVLIRLDNGMIEFQIRDNGVGFDLDQFGSKNVGHTFGGNGLKNMQTRAKEIGANVELHSVLGIGTSIILKLNFKKS